MTTQTRSANPRRNKKPVPEYLIRDEIDGELFYYAGYQDVLDGKKTPEEIMGSSTLQSWIIGYILKMFYTQIGDDKYHAFTNEIGSHLGKKNNLSLDIGFFDKKVLTVEHINSNYASVPASVTIEVDIKIDTNKLTEMDFVHKKTQKLIDTGVEKVIWIFTRSQRILIATPGNDWLNVDWNREIELLDGHAFNIGKALEEAGIKL